MHQSSFSRYIKIRSAEIIVRKRAKTLPICLSISYMIGAGTKISNVCTYIVEILTVYCDLEPLFRNSIGANLSQRWQFYYRNGCVIEHKLEIIINSGVWN